LWKSVVSMKMRMLIVPLGRQQREAADLLPLKPPYRLTSSSFAAVAW
jgi:hypothetical protein